MYIYIYVMCFSTAMFDARKVKPPVGLKGNHPKANVCRDIEEPQLVCRSPESFVGWENAWISISIHIIPYLS